MEGRIQNNLKECALGFLMLLLVASGCIASFGAFNWAKEEGWLFIVAGVLNIGFTIYNAIAFYKKFLKPSKS